MIYFARNPNDSLIKIGFTKNFRGRQGALRNDCFGAEVKIFAVMEGGVIKERSLHQKFSHLSVTKQHRGSVSREWFSPSPELLAFIDANATSWDHEPTGPGRKKLPKDEARDAFAQIRMTKRFHEWMTGYLQWKGVSLSDFFELFLRRSAKKDKYPEVPPEKR